MMPSLPARFPGQTFCNLLLTRATLFEQAMQLSPLQQRMDVQSLNPYIMALEQGLLEEKQRKITLDFRFSSLMHRLPGSQEMQLLKNLNTPEGQEYKDLMQQREMILPRIKAIETQLTKIYEAKASRNGEFRELMHRITQFKQ